MRNVGRNHETVSFTRGRGQGYRGYRGSPRGGRPYFNRPGYPQILPTIQQVVSGAHVSIVLKVDQPTGRQVQGTIAEVLTSGNHPRGIKVRLQDGRVGRVQRMASEEEARNGSGDANSLGRNGEALEYIKAPKQKKRRNKDQSRAASGNPEPTVAQTQGLDTVTCPMCSFQGDEAAVAHHVDSHFAG
ncbi:hypothetical protein M501DRAFT_975866 [Patellaria atrata CBS 101060]|uniref:UBZ4-type domain-containing protein n=1 Tax=Patellaria atrata CBS 101060 TaxID=1346257 RepID=A0A9P4SAA4_9PEZI|nr:hypothetical protein M501DRAFT_975866 [Patellaria atrata CBS 101060]